MEKKKKEKKIMKEKLKTDKVGDEKTVDLLQNILKSNQEILQSNKEIAASSSFIKRYIRNRIIITTVKWVLIVIVLVLGFMSLTSVFDYVRENLDYYEDKVGQVLEFKDVIDNY